MSDVEITGGAGPHEAAAVMAALAQSMEEEAAASAIGSVTPRPTDWQRAASDHLKPVTEPGSAQDTNAWPDDPGDSTAD